MVTLCIRNDLLNCCDSSMLAAFALMFLLAVWPKGGVFFCEYVYVHSHVDVISSGVSCTNIHGILDAGSKISRILFELNPTLSNCLFWLLYMTKASSKRSFSPVFKFTQVKF